MNRERRVLRPRPDDREMVEAMLTGFFVAEDFPMGPTRKRSASERAQWVADMIERGGYTFVRLRKGGRIP